MKPHLRWVTSYLRMTGWLWLAFSTGLYAQVDTGTIRGTVTDSSGRVVPGASITLREQRTGVVARKSTSADGTYLFTPVRIGTYEISAASPGFGKVTVSDAALNVQQNLVVDLTPGQVNTTVEVNTAAPLLQSEDASVGQVMSARDVTSLPLNGRNYTLLAQLTTGVTTTSQESRGLGASGSFVSNGVPSIYNNYILDGIDNNNNTVDFLNGAAYVVRPPMAGPSTSPRCTRARLRASIFRAVSFWAGGPQRRTRSGSAWPGRT